MGLENIINKILQDASTKANTIAERSKKACDEILKKAKEEADALSEKILSQAKQKAQQEAEKFYAMRNIEIKKDILSEKRELIERAFSEAYKKLLVMDDKKYLEILKELILKNVKDKEECQLQFFRKDASRIKKDFIEDLNKKNDLNLTFGPYFDRDDLGFILKKGKILFDFSFSKGMNFLKDNIQSEVSLILFG